VEQPSAKRDGLHDPAEGLDHKHKRLQALLLLAFGIGQYRRNGCRHAHHCCRLGHKYPKTHQQRLLLC